MTIVSRIATGLLVVLSNTSWGFQLAPMGSNFEARLTNETPNWLSTIAGRVGVILKEPVHEEITQLGFGCPIDLTNLSSDKSCMGANHGFASHFVIYGVRWNDLPPFMLHDSEGSKCKKVMNPLVAACNVQQTVRFSTQPDCWYCLFKDAQEKAIQVKITGCQRDKGYVRGNLMTRSHFGDLQFLHGMANEDNIPPEETQKKILDWAQFTWKVASREIASSILMKTIDIPTIQEHFGCSEWSVADIYILGRNPQLLPYVQQIAFGSLLHTVQDSFAAGHTERQTTAPGGTCPGTEWPRPPQIVEFHSYADQDGHAHDQEDARTALVSTPAADWPLAVAATRQLVNLSEAGASWSDVRQVLECAFSLAPGARVSGAGERFRRRAAN